MIGLLTILGFSLYDTVVVFDKVKENTRGLLGLTRRTYAEAANLALNQTLMRSINTSLIAVLPVLGLIIVGVGLLGVGTLADLALVLFVGILAGAYSSIFSRPRSWSTSSSATPASASRRARVAARRARVAAARGGARPPDRRATSADLSDDGAGTASCGGSAPWPPRRASRPAPTGSAAAPRRQRPTGKGTRPTGKRRR